MLILKNFIGWALEGMSFNDWSDVVAPKVQKHLAFAQRTAFVGTGLFFSYSLPSVAFLDKLINQTTLPQTPFLVHLCSTETPQRPCCICH